MNKLTAFAIVAVLATQVTAAREYDVNAVRPGSLTAKVEALLNPWPQPVDAIGTTGNSRPRDHYGPPGELPKEDFSSIRKGSPALGGS